MDKIAVLMSTYNGEKYLDRQIESIISQQNVNVQILIRDDGSSDSTKDIIIHWQETHPYKVILLEDQYGNLGSANSFIQLLKLTLSRYPEIEYFAFADQDDVWLPGKLERAYSFVENHDKPCLYFSKKTITDQNLEKIAEDHVRFVDSFFQYFTTSNASGCTFLFTRKLAEKCIKKPKYNKIFHDAWIYRIAGCTGCEVFYDEKSYILYRQHDSNVVGKIEYWNLRKAMSRVFQKRNHILQKTFCAINDQFGDELNIHAQSIVPYISSYRKSFRSRMRILFWKEAYQVGIKNGITWSIMVLLNGL